MTTPTPFAIETLTGPTNATSISGIPISSAAPTAGQALAYNLPMNQFQYVTLPTLTNLVDLTSAQTISGVKTIGTSLGFSAGANIIQGANTFTFPAASGQLAVVPAGPGNAFVDLTSVQTISGVKTIGSSLQFSAGATLGQGANTFTLPSASGQLAVVPAGPGNAFVDLTSAQTISGVKTIGTSLGFSAGANIIQGANTFTFPAASGQLAVVPAGPGNAFVDLTSAQTISGVKTIGTSLGFSAGANIIQGANTFTLPSSSGQLEVQPTTSNTPEGMNALAAITTGTNNTGLGFQALQNLTTGSGNVAVGSSALNADVSVSNLTAVGTNALTANTSGTANVAFGFNALVANTTGSNNTALGQQTLSTATTGSGNVAIGATALSATTTVSNLTAVGTNALAANTSGSPNTSVGANSLQSNIDGTNNVAVGFSALSANAHGNANIAIGDFALSSNTADFNVAVGFNALMTSTAAFNTAIGTSAMANTTTGGNNVAVGHSAMLNNTTGFVNVAIGDGSLQSNTTGDHNTSIGNSSLLTNSTGQQNTGIGAIALRNLVSGNNNVALGFQAGSALTAAESNNILIANLGAVGESGAIRIGAFGGQTSCFIQGISGVTVAGAVPVVVASDGQLGTTVSSRRFKKDIVSAKEYDVSGLRVVNFRYKDSSVSDVGLIAEEVEQVIPELVIYDEEGLPKTVNYMALIPILIQEIQRLKEKTK